MNSMMTRSIYKTQGGTTLLSKKNIPSIFLCILFSLLWYFTTRCETIESLDLHRYYEGAILMKDLPVKDIFDWSFTRSLDFIYFLLLHFALKLSISLNLLTTIIVTLYYVMIISCMKEIYRGRMEWYVICAVLFLAPITWIIEISRNLTAIVFLYISIKMYYKRKWVWVLFFTLLSLFTHFSLLMYIAVFALSIILCRFHITNLLMAMIIIVVMVVSYLIPSNLLDLLSIALSDYNSDLGSHYSNMTVRGVSDWNNVNYGDVLPTLYSLFFSIVLLLYNTKQGIEHWMLFLSALMLAFFINSSQLFTNRCIMVLPLFWGLNVADIYSRRCLNDKVIISLFSLVAVVVILLHFWSYRLLYNPF